MSPVEQPQYIDAESGACLSIDDSTGLPKDTEELEQVVLYLTKPLSLWEPLEQLLVDAIWTAPSVREATV